MNVIFHVIFALSVLGSGIASAAEKAPVNPGKVNSSASATRLPVGVTEEMMAPPPVPAFMLEKPEKPLSMEEMVRQAREAEKKAGVPASKTQVKPTTGGGTTQPAATR